MTTKEQKLKEFREKYVPNANIKFGFYGDTWVRVLDAEYFFSTAMDEVEKEAVDNFIERLAIAKDDEEVLPEIKRFIEKLQSLKGKPPLHEKDK